MHLYITSEKKDAKIYKKISYNAGLFYRYKFNKKWFLEKVYNEFLYDININNKKFKFQNRENRENFSGGHGQELMTLSINEAYAKYLIPIPYSLFVEQNIEDFS